MVNDKQWGRVHSKVNLNGRKSGRGTGRARHRSGESGSGSTEGSVHVTLGAVEVVDTVKSKVWMKHLALLISPVNCAHVLLVILITLSLHRS